MKKSYIEPAINMVSVVIENVMQTTSSVSVGEDWSEGEASSRGGWDDED